MGCQCSKPTNQESQNEILSKDKENKDKQGASSSDIKNQASNERRFSKGESNHDKVKSAENKVDQDTGSIRQGQTRSSDKIALNPNYNQTIDMTNNYPSSDSFANELLTQLNRIRANPKAYADTIEDSICYIQADRNKLIYNNGVKVRLTRGKDAFIEASQALKLIKPAGPLTYKQEMCIPVPATKQEMEDKKYLINQIGMLSEKCNIDSFWNYQVGIPETSLLLMIVSDTKAASGKKRNDLLSPTYKYIGISSVQFDKFFNSYLTFSQ